MYMFSMTGLTGQNKNAGRTMVIATFEVSRRSFIVTVLALLVSIVPTGLLSPIAFTFGMTPGVIVLVTIPLITVVAAFFFVEGRSREGLGLRRYEAMWDKRKARNGAVFVCNELIVQPYIATIASADVELRPEYDEVDSQREGMALSTAGSQRTRKATNTGGWLE